MPPMRAQKPVRVRQRRPGLVQQPVQLHPLVQAVVQAVTDSSGELGDPDLREREPAPD